MGNGEGRSKYWLASDMWRQEVAGRGSLYCALVRRQGVGRSICTRARKKNILPLPLWERSTRVARRERGCGTRRLLRRRHPLPNPSPIEGERLKTCSPIGGEGTIIA